MVHSAMYGRIQNTRKRTYYAPGGVSGAPFPAPPPRGEFSVLRVPCVSRLLCSTGPRYGGIGAHFRTQANPCRCWVVPVFWVVPAWWRRGGVAVFWPKQAASTIVAPLPFWRSTSCYSSFGRS
ncbi:uncharacterized protein TM35_000331720 [Trypanosoma theileri]|uniref:Uncharacterized protein n=1 Tax=Trypanosoma theileri TaxID=67003 RepID=A0A1X0NLW8_9TRYP|nr:uncharacterized protein TM35_000331720 [Trypanosoma theileri]ORC85715.1 hypothetical protein TM35_000331720 [Trypanosoma theileri]